MDIKVLLFEDHQFLVDGILSTLEVCENIKVVATYNSVDDAVGCYKKHEPDVTVLDIKYKGEKTGIHALEEILAYDKDAFVVILSQYDQEYLIMKAYELGAKAFVTKADTSDQLVNAILSVSKNEKYIPPSTAQKIAKSVTMGNSIRSLDEKELQVFTMVAQGLTHQEIADQLKIHKKTVGVHAQSIKAKLGIDRAAEFTLMAVDEGIISTKHTRQK